jgi:MraZ protein
VEVDDFFQGSALNAVDAKGRLSVPAFVRSAIEQNSKDRTIILAAHEVSPCVVAYGPGYSRRLKAELEERRGREEERGAASREGHYSSRRRAFGTVEIATYDPSGRILMPQKMRRRGRIEDLALFIGIGDVVEIWNPRIALEQGDAELRDIVLDCLDEKGMKL